MTAVIVVGCIEILIGIVALVIAFTTSEGAFGVVAFVAFAVGALVLILALTEHNYDIARARKQVDATCYPYQVRNLHLTDHTFLFNCANDQRLRIVRAR